MTETATPRAVLFDWDNTLVDSWGVIGEAFNRTLADFNRPEWALERIQHQLGHSLRDTFPQLFGPQSDQATQRYYHHFEAIHIDRLDPLPGVADTLATLFERGIYLGLVSNKTGRFLRKEAAHLGWDRYFGRMVGATDAAADKPAADPVHLALTGSGVPAGDQVWLVGDAHVDIECARNAGCRAILVGEHATGPQSEARHTPDFRIKGLPALLGLVKGAAQDV